MNYDSLCQKYNLSHFPGQLFEAEWFLDEPVAAAFQDIGCLAVNRIAAGQYNFNVWVHLLEFIKCFAAAHNRHYHIQNHQNNVILMEFKEL